MGHFVKMCRDYRKIGKNKIAQIEEESLSSKVKDEEMIDTYKGMVLMVHDSKRDTNDQKAMLPKCTLIIFGKNLFVLADSILAQHST